MPRYTRNRNRQESPEDSETGSQERNNNNENYVDLLEAMTTSFRSLCAPVKIPKFNPILQEVAGWLATYKQAIPQEKERINQLNSAFKGTASNWYATERRLLNGTERNWNEWERAIYEEFGKNEADVFNELNNRKQQPGEDSKKYCSEVINLCSLANMHMSEQEKINYLLRGLQPQFREKIVLMRPKTSTQFVKDLKVIESNCVKKEENALDQLLSTIAEKLKEPATKHIPRSGEKRKRT